MTRYILECPACRTRMKLRRHVPGRRLRCRSCRKILVVPEGPEPSPAPESWEPKPLPPELRARLVKALSLRRLAVLSLLLFSALVGAAIALAKKNERRGRPEPPPPAPRLTLDRLAEAGRLMALPLGRGYSWEYALAGGGTEERRVALLSRGLEDEPLADLAITGSLEAGKQTLRVTPEGVHLVAEARGDGRYSFSPPLCVVPHPIYLGESWKYSGARTREGGAAEDWSLEYRVAAQAEAVDTGVGRHTCFRVEVKGSRGPRRVEETLWYARGVGLVKRLSRVDDRSEEALLMRFDRK